MTRPDLASLRALASDLFYPSESDAPLVVVDLGVGAVEAVVHATYTDAEPLDVDAFFAAPARGGFATEFPDNVAGFERLRAALEDALGPLTGFVAGAGIEKHLVAGRDANGHVVAVVAEVVAT